MVIEKVWSLSNKQMTTDTHIHTHPYTFGTQQVLLGLITRERYVLSQEQTELSRTIPSFREKDRTHRIRSEKYWKD